MTDFSARRPVIKNAIRLALSLVGAAFWIILFLLFYKEDPTSFNAKLFQVILFCIFVIGGVFSVSFFLDALRCLLSPPTVFISAEKVKIFGYPERELSDLEKTEITEGKLYVYLKNEKDPMIIKRNFTGIPLDTVKYAIDVRMSK